MKMNKRFSNKVKGLVNELGLIGALNILGDEKGIIRQAYLDDPISYLDYLIGNLNLIMNQEIGRTVWSYNYKTNIFATYSDEDIVTVDDFIWNYFYKKIMLFDDTKIESIFTEWLYKHIPSLSEKKPIVYSDFEEFGKLWKKQKAIHNNLVGSNQSYPSGGIIQI